MEDLIKRAEDQYHQASRWSWILVLVLAAIHASLLSPFASFKTSERKTAAELARLTDGHSALAAAAAAIDDLRGTTQKRLDKQVKNLIKRLRFDFERLELTRQVLLRGPEAAGLPPLSPDSPDSMVQSTVQHAPPNSGIGGGSGIGQDGPIYIEDENLRALLANQEASRAEIIEGLRPFVAAEIIAPRFAELNRAWTNEILPDAGKSHERITKEITVLAAGLPDAGEIIAQLRTTVDQLWRYMQDRRFAPPAGSDWWTSVRGKVAAGFEISSDVGAQLKRPPALAALEAEVTAALVQQQSLRDSIAADLAALEKQLDATLENLKRVGQPFGAVSLDLDFLAANAPLAVALILTFAAAWRSLTLRELAVSAHLAGDDENGRRLWRWILERPFLILHGAPTPEAAWRAWRIQSAILWLVTLAWVAIAAGDALAATGESFTRQAFPIVLALLLPTAMFVLRLWILRSIVRSAPA